MDVPSSSAALDIRLDDLSGEPTRALIAAHLSDMRSISPEESCHALDLSGLEQPSVQVWSAWVAGELAGVGALAQLDEDNGELKSMRVADSHRGTGIGRAMLEHLIDQARRRGMSALRTLRAVRQLRARPVLPLHDEEAVAARKSELTRGDHQRDREGCDALAGAGETEPVSRCGRDRHRGTAEGP